MGYNGPNILLLVYIDKALFEGNSLLVIIITKFLLHLMSMIKRSTEMKYLKLHNHFIRFPVGDG